MDSEYILVYRSADGKGQELQNKFQAATPEGAKETALSMIRHLQAEYVHEMPFAPIIVEGQLYRQVEEINGAQFIRTQDGRSYEETLPKHTST